MIFIFENFKVFINLIESAEAATAENATQEDTANDSTEEAANSQEQAEELDENAAEGKIYLLQ